MLKDVKKTSGKLQLEAFHKGYDEGVKETLTQLEREVGGMEIEIPKQVSNKQWGKGYNQALQDVINLIKKYRS